MADTRISQLAPLAVGDVDAAVDQLAIADISAAETKKVSPADVVQAGLPSITDGTIPGAKLTAGSVGTTQLADGSVSTAKLQDGAVVTTKLQDLGVTAAKIADGTITAVKIAADTITAAQIAPGAVDSSELANQAVDTAAIQDLAVTSAKLAANSVGAAALADGSVDTGAIVNQAVTTAKIADANVTTAKLANGAVTTDKIANLAVTQDKIALGAVGDAQITGPISLSKLPTAGANQVLAGPTSGAAAAPTARALVAADLPVATAAARGAASFPTGSGLAVAGGAVSIDNAATGTEGPYVFYNAKGLVTSSRALTDVDLPLATDTTVGAVKPGQSLSVAADGTLNHAASLLGAQVGLVKIDTDVNGHVIGSDLLAASDIPNLPADKIVGGTFDASLIADRSITREQLADYAIAYIQEAQPAVPPDAHIGCLWLQESSGQLRIWNGNSFYPVGFGRLATENLRWGGIIDASTDRVTIVTELGAAAGLTVGNALPAATASLSGLYMVVGTPGNAISVTPAITYDAGDWVLCVDQAQGWVRIDTLVGGGGGGLQHLNDLLDVTISTPQSGQTLVFNNATGQWVNATPATAPVTSVFGRTGAVVALEGDYSLNLLSDVDLTTTPPANGNLLRFNSGTGQWTPVAPSTISVTTTRGDLIQRGTTADQRLPIGTPGQVLSVNAGGTLAEWKTIATPAIQPASETVAGIAEIATQAEVDAATDDLRFVTPLKLGTYVSQSLWIDGGSAVSNFGSAPAAIDGGGAV